MQSCVEWRIRDITGAMMPGQVSAASSAARRAGPVRDR